MTPNEIRLQMAILDGYPPSCKINIEAEPLFSDDGELVFYPLCLVPDYANNLDAVARVVGIMNDGDRTMYLINLNKITGHIVKSIDATALQRCEAILRACGKWVDG